MNEAEELARKRFTVLTAVRFSAVAFVFAAMANIAGKLLPEFAPVLGYALLIIGLVDFFVAPMILNRAWRTPDA